MSAPPRWARCVCCSSPARRPCSLRSATGCGGGLALDGAPDVKEVLARHKIISALLPLNNHHSMQVDAMCIHLATLLVDATDADGGATLLESGAEPPVELVLAGLRALEASVTVARAHRAPYLARATDVFRRAAGLGLPIVADAAREALLSIAAVLHPRSAPLLTPEIRQLQRQAESRSEQRDIGVAAMEEKGAFALPAPIFWAPAAEGPARADDDGQLGLPSPLMDASMGPTSQPMEVDAGAAPAFVPSSAIAAAGPATISVPPSAPVSLPPLASSQATSGAAVPVPSTQAAAQQPPAVLNTTTPEPSTLTAFQAPALLGGSDSEDEGGALEPPAAAAEVPPPAPKIPELPSSLPRELPLELDSEDESLPDIDSGASDNEA